MSAVDSRRTGREKMKRRTERLTLVVGLAVGLIVAVGAGDARSLTAPISSTGNESDACRFLDFAFDGLTSGSDTELGPFVAGEIVTMSASAPETTSGDLSLAVNGEIVDTAPFPGSVGYVIPSDGTYRLEWGTAGNVTWEVSCVAGAVVLDFEGLQNLEPILDYYNGGDGGFGSYSGPNYGISFDSDSLALIDADAGGTGNFANEPSPDTTAFFLGGSGVVMTVERGFSEGFSFFYSAAQPASVTVHAEPGGQGEVLATVDLVAQGGSDEGCSLSGDPNGYFACFDPVGVEFEGTAYSVNFSGAADLVGFDNITIGASSPGGEDPGGDDTDHPPAISLSAPDVAVDEGQTGTTGGSFDDPDGDPLTITCDCPVGSITDNGDGSWSWSGTPPDGPATHDLAVTATDPSGFTTVDSFSVTVANVAPTVDSITAPLDLVEVGTEINASGVFGDSGVLDTHDGAWDWGDGTASAAEITETDGSGTAGGTHSYTTPGVYTLTLTITDKDGASGSAIFEYVVVYDPDAGFVTGGGWIDSPEGAYTPDPDLTGKAKFGFVSKYQKGATVPTGETQFNFKVADLDFHSTEYQWMVVAGPKAQYKGSGTINQTGDYGFILTAWDGQVNGGNGEDKFRIKIWDKATDEVIYDNQFEDDLNADPTTVIGGGSIVIHGG